MLSVVLASFLCCGALLLNSNPSPASVVAVPSPTMRAGTLRISSESAALTFAASGSGEEREASTVLRISAIGGEVSPLHPLQVLVSISEVQAMRAGGRASLNVANLRVRNDRDQWVPLQPLPELNGRFGVRIAIVRSAPASCLLQVQLHLSAGQKPGDYSGLLTIEAQEQ